MVDCPTIIVVFLVIVDPSWLILDLLPNVDVALFLGLLVVEKINFFHKS